MWHAARAVSLALSLQGCVLSFDRGSTDGGSTDGGTAFDGAGFDAARADGAQVDSAITPCPAVPAAPLAFTESAQPLGASSLIATASSEPGSTTAVALLDLEDDGDDDILVLDRVGLPPQPGRSGSASRMLRSDVVACELSTLADVTTDLTSGIVPMGDTTAGDGPVLAAPLFGAGPDLVRPETYGQWGETYRWLDGRWQRSSFLPLATGLAGGGLVVGDLNEDGVLDVLMLASEAGPLATPLFLSREIGGVVRWEAASAPPGLDDLGAAWIADLDRDDHLDVIGVPRTNQPGRLYLGDGLGGLADTPGRGADRLVAASGVALGDFDRDGDLDVLQYRAERDAGGLTGRAFPELLTNDGGVFSAPATLDAAIAWTNGNMPPTRYSATADFDLDGQLDAAFGRYSGAFVLRNTTLPAEPVSFANAVAMGTDDQLDAGSEHGFAVGDVDGDGDLDVVLPGAPGNFVSGLRVFATDARRERALGLRLRDGTWGIGAEVCVYAGAATLPADGSCPSAGLLGWQVVMAGTTSPRSAQVVFGVPSEDAVRVRVRWPRRGGARAISDHCGLAVPAKHVLAPDGRCPQP